MDTLANSEDPDEMPHKTVFNQGLHSLLIGKTFSEKVIQSNLKIITCHPTIFIGPSQNYCFKP